MAKQINKYYSLSNNSRAFSCDVTVAILVFKNKEMTPDTYIGDLYQCTKPVLWELNSIFMQKLSFVRVNQ